MRSFALRRRLWIAPGSAALAVALVVLAQASPTVSAPPPTHATGFVFHDRDGDGDRDRGEEGIGGVSVSNQREVVVTDPDGRWRLPLVDPDDTTFFVVKPRGWMTPVTGVNTPVFYYSHKPTGSPKSRFRGVSPTGPLPSSIDFALRPQSEPDDFRALLFGDPQPRDRREVDYIARDVVAELIGWDGAFGITLGDIVFDDLSVLRDMTETTALIGVPWWHVIGNHDLNRGAKEDRWSDETYERWFGPSYYAFDWGPVHFIVLDDVDWLGPTKERPRGTYAGGIGAQQLAFVENDLALVPDDRLVVVAMHIPIPGVRDRSQLYRLLEKRSYAMSVSGHTHFQENVYLDEDDGWRGKEPHHHLINVTVCGSWWTGAPDALGIPHTTMRDGAPNGYSIASFSGNEYSIRFKASRRPDEFQMAIHAPSALAEGAVIGTKVVVNVFGGSARSKVGMRWNDEGPWRELAHVTDERPDPAYAAMHAAETKLLAAAEEKLEGRPWRPLPKPRPSAHLWEGAIATSPGPGWHTLTVRTIDAYGQEDLARRPIRIDGPPPARPAKPAKPVEKKKVY